MRSKLIKSFLVVFIFWWLAIALSWALGDPQNSLNTLRRLADTLRWVGVTVTPPTASGLMDLVTWQWRVQMAVLRLWTLPVMGLTVLATLLGVALVWIRAMRSHQEREERIADSGEFRGVTVRLGPLPTPRLPPRAAVTLRPSPALDVLTPGERTLLTDVLGLIAAQPQAFAGENRPAGSLLNHALAAAHRALSARHRPGLAAITAAAGELGKLTAWAADGQGGWFLQKNENREAARLLAGLDSWYALPYVDRMAVLFAVKYRGIPGDMPEAARDPNVYRLARSLLEVETAAPVPAPVEIRQAVFEQRDPEVELLAVFERELSTLPFQSQGLPKNIPAVGWKKKGRAYLLENQLANHLLPKLPPETRAVLAPAQRDKTARVTPMTAALLKVFHAQGWLVVEHGPNKVPPTEALWVIQAGKLEFSRVMILELPGNLVDKLPAGDSVYTVEVKWPMFQPAVQNTVSKDDLMGGLLRPKTGGAPKPADPVAPGPAPGAGNGAAPAAGD